MKKFIFYVSLLFSLQSCIWYLFPDINVNICIENMSGKDIFYTCLVVSKESNFSSSDFEPYAFEKIPDSSKIYRPEIMEKYELKYKNLHFLFIDETVFENEGIDKILRDSSLWYKHIIIHSEAELKSINNTIIVK